MMTENSNPLMNGLRAIRSAVDATMPGLKNFGQDIASELQNQLGHGAHEIGAALFNGNAFVMYGHGSSKDQEISPMQSILNPPAPEVSNEPAQEQSLEQNRGGIER